MTKQTHTKKPWSINNQHINNDQGQAYIEAADGTICEIFRGRQIEETKANATLIAAAPDMECDLIYARQAMRWAVEMVKKMPDYRGSNTSSKDYVVAGLIEQINRINKTLEKIGVPYNSDAAIAKAEGR